MVLHNTASADVSLCLNSSFFSTSQIDFPSQLSTMRTMNDSLSCSFRFFVACGAFINHYLMGLPRRDSYCRRWQTSSAKSGGVDHALRFRLVLVVERDTLLLFSLPFDCQIWHPLILARCPCHRMYPCFARMWCSSLEGTL